MHCLSFVQNKIMSKLGPVKCVPFLNMLVLWRLCLFLPAFSGPACHSWLNPSKWSIAQFSIGSTASTGFRGFEKLSIPAKRVLFGWKMTKLCGLGVLGGFKILTHFLKFNQLQLNCQIRYFWPGFGAPRMKRTKSLTTHSEIIFACFRSLGPPKWPCWVWLFFLTLM